MRTKRLSFKLNNMNIRNLLETGANITVNISLLDLKEAFLLWGEELKQNNNTADSEKYLTTNEVSKRLGVDDSTLWRWNKIGYLKKIKLGNKVFYKESDILKLM